MDFIFYYPGPSAGTSATTANQYIDDLRHPAMDGQAQLIMELSPTDTTASIASRDSAHSAGGIDLQGIPYPAPYEYGNFDNETWLGLPASGGPHNHDPYAGYLPVPPLPPRPVAYPGLLPPLSLASAGLAIAPPQFRASHGIANTPIFEAPGEPNEMDDGRHGQAASRAASSGPTLPTISMSAANAPAAAPPSTTIRKRVPLSQKKREREILSGKGDAALLALKPYGDGAHRPGERVRGDASLLYALLMKSGWTSLVKSWPSLVELEEKKQTVQDEAMEMLSFLGHDMKSNAAIVEARDIVVRRLNEQIALLHASQSGQDTAAQGAEKSKDEIRALLRHVRERDPDSCVWCGEERMGRKANYQKRHLGSYGETSCPVFSVLKERDLLAAWREAHEADILARDRWQLDAPRANKPTSEAAAEDSEPETSTPKTHAATRRGPGKKQRQPSPAAANDSSTPGPSNATTSRKAKSRAKRYQPY